MTRVIVVGAGAAGILAAIRRRKTEPGCSFWKKWPCPAGS